MQAILIGATGATGKDLLDLLLKDDTFNQVKVFVRRTMGFSHEKLVEYIIDFNAPEHWKYLVQGDVLFSCLGTTLKAAGSKEAQWKIDYDYQYEFAKIARQNGVEHHILVSAGYASAKSPVFYSRMKGKLEEDVKALGFPKQTIFNPPVLIRKNSDRPMEVTGLKVIQFFNKLGLFQSQKPLPTEVLAQAMLNSAKAGRAGLQSLQGQEIWERAKT